jgi:V/A-type H+/Na+-transporting ATPase subunit B
MPDQMVETGIPMIDVFNSLVESQKLPIFSVAGEPYNELLARIGLQANADIIILGGMGLRHDDYLKFRQTFEEGGVLGRAIMFIHTAADPVVECLLVPDLCLAVGEQFALQGKRVLVLLTDMTAFSDALKEIAIIMEQIPSNRGYPGDLYTQLARRYEKAVDFDGAGSMTVLACVTMPGDDVTHPVPDNTGYITEGQFYLRNGRIEPFGSLSRLKQQVNGETRDDHRCDHGRLHPALCLVPREPRKAGHGLRDVGLGPQAAAVRQLFESGSWICRERPLFEALDRCWKILAECFEPAETGIRRAIIEKHWPEALADLREQSRRQSAVQVLREGEQLLQGELSRVIQRVNLFEKIMIPKDRDAIRRIRIKLGDEMAAAVGRAKIAKGKLAKVLEEASLSAASTETREADL